MKKLLAVSCLALLAACATTTMPQNITNEEPIIFESRSGGSAEAFKGTFQVPENRSDPNSRLLTLHYVRFPSTGEKKGPPIIYLAGGPGGSGIETAKHERFPLFMAMRAFGDVIAFDQRGTGASNDLPNCRSSEFISTISPTSDAGYFDTQRIAFAECLDFWRSEGVDVLGYNTLESAADLDDLRIHLGAENVSLWGISYGSHLALAALKTMDQRIDRVVMTAVEGLDQTIKQPARSDLYFARLQAAIDEVPEAKAKYPDIAGLIRRVLDRLEEEPLRLDIPKRGGGTNPFLLQRRDMQQFTGALVADPARVVLALNLYRSLDTGDTRLISQVLAQAVDPTDMSVSFRPMTTLMDVASGSGPARRAMIREQAKTALLSQYTNFSMHLETVDPSLDLGASFRTPPVSDVPTLVLSGTLDGRTFPESGQEATAGLSGRQTVTVTNAGHNLFMLSPEITATIEDFMRGEDVDGRNIAVDLPAF